MYDVSEVRWYGELTFNEGKVTEAQFTVMAPQEKEVNFKKSTHYGDANEKKLKYELSVVIFGHFIVC